MFTNSSPRGIAALPVIAIVLVVTVLTIGAWYLATESRTGSANRGNTDPLPNQNTNEAARASNVNANATSSNGDLPGGRVQRTYENNSRGIRFDIPAGWLISSEEDSGGALVVNLMKGDVETSGHLNFTQPLDNAGNIFIAVSEDSAPEDGGVETVGGLSETRVVTVAGVQTDMTIYEGRYALAFPDNQIVQTEARLAVASRDGLIRIQFNSGGDERRWLLQEFEDLIGTIRR